MIDYRIRIDGRGPLLDGRGPAHIRRAIDDIEHEVARYGKDQVQQRLNRVLRTQTPYYRTRIRAVRTGGRWEVNDSGVIYGPWLEGVGSRNYPVTRFRGYGTFRWVAQRVQHNATRIAERVLRPYLRRL
jgi:hypothetical protein